MKMPLNTSATTKEKAMDEKEVVKKPVPKAPLKEIQPGDVKPGQTLEQAQAEADKKLREQKKAD